MLRGSIGVSIFVAKTDPVSRHLSPAAARSSSWANRCCRNTASVDSGTPTRRADPSVFTGPRDSTPLPDIRRHLHYVGQLIDKRATLDQRRRLLTVGGWLSLIAATVDIDLHQRHAAGARLATATSLAEQTSNSELGAWCLETQAWDALTEGRCKLAVDLAQTAQEMAPGSGSAFIQVTAQEGRAWARLADDRATRDALRRVERIVCVALTYSRPARAPLPIRPREAARLHGHHTLMDRGPGGRRLRAGSSRTA